MRDAGKGNINSIVLGVILILVTIILMPLILTENDAILAHGNITTFTGLSAIADVGPLIILLGLFASGGFFTFSGIRGKGAGGKKDIAYLVGTVVALVVALILFQILMTQFFTLNVAVLAASGNVTALSAIVVIIPMVLYVGIIVSAAAVHYKTHRRVGTGYRRGRR